MRTRLLVMGANVTRAYPTDSGMDVYALEDIDVVGTNIIHTGVSCAVIVDDPHPDYNVTWTMGIFVKEKSGLAAKGLIIGGGVVDNSYRGEVCIIARCYGDAVTIRKGSKIAQLVVQRVELPEIIYVDQLPEGVRGLSGFGSSGS